MVKLLKKTVKTSLGTIVAGQPLPDKLPKREADHIRNRGLIGETEVSARATDDDRSRRIAELEAANAKLQARGVELTATLEIANAEVAGLKEKLEASDGEIGALKAKLEAADAEIAGLKTSAK